MRIEPDANSAEPMNTQARQKASVDDKAVPVHK